MDDVEQAVSLTLYALISQLTSKPSAPPHRSLHSQVLPVLRHRSLECEIIYFPLLLRNFNDVLIALLLPVHENSFPVTNGTRRNIRIPSIPRAAQERVFCLSSDSLG